MTPFQTYRDMQEASRPESATDLSAQANSSSHHAYERTKPGHEHAQHTWAYKDHEAAQIAHTLRAEKAEGHKKKYHEMQAAHHAQMAAHHKALGMPGNW